MVIYLIRHGMTAGNQKKRYIGRTDEPLCQEGRERLEQIRKCALYERPDLLYVSPMLRCLETAQILFPGMKQSVIADFRECDFGEFENQNYLELAGNANYQKWIDSKTSGGDVWFNTKAGTESYDQVRGTKAVYDLIFHNADVIAGVLHGHVHANYITTIKADYTDENGNVIERDIPQYCSVLTGGEPYSMGIKLIIK